MSDHDHITTKIRLELAERARMLVNESKGGRDTIIAEVARALEQTYTRGYNDARPIARAAALREIIMIEEAIEGDARRRRAVLERELAELLKVPT